MRSGNTTLRLYTHANNVLSSIALGKSEYVSASLVARVMSSSLGKALSCSRGLVVGSAWRLYISMRSVSKESLIPNIRTILAVQLHS